jgi:hypothetical protein
MSFPYFMYSTASPLYISEVYMAGRQAVRRAGGRSGGRAGGQAGRQAGFLLFC